MPVVMPSNLLVFVLQFFAPLTAASRSICTGRRDIVGVFCVTAGAYGRRPSSGANNLAGKESLPPQPIQLTALELSWMS